MEHEFKFEGKSLVEEIERLIPQLLDYHYALQTKDIVRMLHCMLMNEKYRPAPLISMSPAMVRALTGKGPDEKPGV